MQWSNPVRFASTRLATARRAMFTSICELKTRPSGPSLNGGFIVLLALLPLGCIQRQLTVHSDPEGAVVFLNDREMGRTPFTREFLWYGNYDVVLRMDGYQTLKTVAPVNAPIWQFVPFDAITDFLPLKDEHTISFKLKPDAPVDPQLLVQRGFEMQQELESSQHTVRHSVLDVHPPPVKATLSTTEPTTEPTTGPATAPATTQP